MSSHEPLTPEAFLVDIAPDLAAFPSEFSHPGPACPKLAYASAALGGSFHLGYLYYSLKMKKRKEALGF